MKVLKKEILSYFSGTQGKENRARFKKRYNELAEKYKHPLGQDFIDIVVMSLNSAVRNNDQWNELDMSPDKLTAGTANAVADVLTR